MQFYDDFKLFMDSISCNSCPQDPWCIVDEKMKITVRGEKFTELYSDKFCGFSENVNQKLSDAFEMQSTLNATVKINIDGNSVPFWLCIVPVLVANKDKFLLVYMQIITDKMAHKLSYNEDDNCLVTETELNFSKLDKNEMVIIDLLKTGYTQQNLANVLFTSRSNIARKVRILCQKLGFIGKVGTVKLRQYLRGMKK